MTANLSDIGMFLVSVWAKEESEQLLFHIPARMLPRFSADAALLSIMC
jgi:hypothetical protein